MLWVIVLTFLLTPVMAWLWLALFAKRDDASHRPVRGRRLLSADEVARIQNERWRNQVTNSPSNPDSKEPQS